MGPAARKPDDREPEEKLTVVVVDAAAAPDGTLVDRLRLAGWRVLGAGTPEAAVERSRRHAVDVVLVVAPVSDDATRLCLDLRAACLLPVVLMTNGGFSTAVASALERGVDACIERSGDVALFVARLQAVARPARTYRRSLLGPRFDDE